MGKKLKLKVKRGKLKVKLKSGDDRLPLSEGDVRGLLALAMAKALGSGDASVDPRLLVEAGATPLLEAGGSSDPEPIATTD